MLSTGLDASSSDPDITRASCKVGYNNDVLQHINLVQLINTYTNPKASDIVQHAKKAGFISHDLGPALHGCGRVRREIADAELETQCLCARKAALEEELAQLQFDLAKGVHQRAQWDRRRAEMVSCNRARRARVGAIGLVGPSFRFSFL